MTLLLTQDRSAAAGTRRRTLTSRIELGVVSLTFVVLGLALVVSLVYLAHANRVATRGYVLKSLEIEKSNLITESEIWKQQVSEAKSLAVIKNSPVVQEMREVDGARYIRADVSVALAD